MKKNCENCWAWGLFALRLIVGGILVHHGYPKLFGETAELMAFFESTVLPAPGVLLLMAGVIEFFGGIAIILGLWNKLITTLVAIEFAVIILFVKLSNGLAEMELELLLFASLFCLSSTGPGKWSVQELWRKRGMKKGEKGGHGQEAISG